MKKLHNVLEGELLLSHKKIIFKNSNIYIKDNENKIIKAKTHNNSKSPFKLLYEEDYKIENENEEKIAHPRKYHSIKILIIII